MVVVGKCCRRILHWDTELSIGFITLAQVIG